MAGGAADRERPLWILRQYLTMKVEIGRRCRLGRRHLSTDALGSRLRHSDAIRKVMRGRPWPTILVSGG
jgi:hypothetical protein